MQTASAVGIPSKISWSTTAMRRTANGVIHVACGFSGTEKAPHQGREFIHWFEEHSFEGPAQLYQHVRSYWQNINSGVAASIALVFQQDTHITVMSFGYAVVGLLRQESSRWLIDGQQAEQVLEGVLQDGDRLVLATARAQTVTPTLEAWQSTSAEDIAGDLFSRVNSHPASGELAYNVLEWSQRVVTPQQTIDAQTETVIPVEETTSQPVERSENSDNEDFPNADHDYDLFEDHAQSDIPVTKDQAPITSTSAESAPTFKINPPGKSSSKHLIAPEKIAAGIVATQQEQTQKVQRQAMSERWVSVLSKLQSLSWLRLVAVVLVIGGVIGSLMLWRYLNIRQETRDLIQPLEQEVQALQAIPSEQRLEQRDSAKSLLERLQATRAKYRLNRTRLIELTTQVEQLYQSVSGEKDVVNLPVYYDFRLVVANFLATRADRFEDQAVFLDANERKLITLQLQSKNNKTLSQDALGESLDLVANAQDAVVLKSEVLEQVPFSGDDPSTISDLDDLDDPAFLERFGTNLYVLDRGKQQLWRINQESENASPSGWVRSAPGVNFAAATSLAIDGDVWLGTNQGNIYRLRRGERIDFGVEGLLEPFTSTLLLAAIEDGDKLVVVEPSQNRVVVLNKDGVYQQQVTSEQIGGVTDVFISQDEQFAYLIAGSVVYRVEI